MVGGNLIDYIKSVIQVGLILSVNKNANMEKSGTHFEDVLNAADHDLEQRKPSLGDHQLPEEHHAYLMRRHGTVELDPVPDMSDDDPYNWPTWKVGPKNSSCYRLTD